MTMNKIDPEAVRRPVTGIDHARIGVAELESARETYTRLGFTVAPRGRHIGWGTANYTIVFANDYVELLGIVDDKQYVSDLDGFLAGGEGLYQIRLGTDDAAQLADWLKGLGYDARPTRDLGRLIEYAGGEETLRFKLVSLPEELTPGLQLDAFHHLTLDLLHQPGLLSHPNGAHAIAEVTVVMESLDGVREGYTTLFGADAIRGEERRGALSVATGNGTLLFVTPKAFPKRHYDVALDPSLSLPRLAALTLAVRDPKATALYLSGQQIDYEREPDGTVLVSAEQACGVLLEFGRSAES